MPKYAARVLSAGSGSRMKSHIPKQYMMLKDRPLIYYSLKAFEDSGVDRIVLVCAENYIDYCRREIVEKYGLKKVTAIVAGGAQRYDSVYQGLKVVSDCRYVLIHDGARPMLDGTIIENSMSAVVDNKACVVGMPVKDTIKVSDEAGYACQTPDRAHLWQIQTPQTFDYKLIRQAYEKTLEDMAAGKEVPSITDDAMIVEYFGGTRVKLIEGSYRNIKVTTPEDLIIAEAFLAGRK